MRFNQPCNFVNFNFLVCDHQKFFSVGNKHVDRLHRPSTRMKPLVESLAFEIRPRQIWDHRNLFAGQHENVSQSTPNGVWGSLNSLQMERFGRIIAANVSYQDYRSVAPQCGHSKRPPVVSEWTHIHDIDVRRSESVRLRAVTIWVPFQLDEPVGPSREGETI